MSSEIIADADHKMARAVEAMERDFQGIRTGRASTALVERIHVEYYGTSTPLNQLAGISVPEPHQIVIQPWDRGVLGAIEKAIHQERHRPDAERRRDGRPAQHPAAHRGASQGPRHESSTSGWRRPGSRSATCAARPPTSSRRRSATARSGPTRRTASSRRSSSTTDRHIAEVDRLGAAKEQEVLEV